MLAFAQQIDYHAKLNDIVILTKDQQKLPFAALSDGQKAVLLLIGDVAQKMSKLNPHLQENVLQDTSGIVLIDELDLHLHPIWQRRIIEDLRTVFPKVQFFATTHSPISFNLYAMLENCQFYKTYAETPPSLQIYQRYPSLTLPRVSRT